MPKVGGEICGVARGRNPTTGSTGRILEGFIGIAIVVAIIFWLTRPQVKATFR
jgi:hypothetical protein